MLGLSSSFLAKDHHVADQSVVIIAGRGSVICLAGPASSSCSLLNPLVAIHFTRLADFPNESERKIGIGQLQRQRVGGGVGHTCTCKPHVHWQVIHEPGDTQRV